MTAGSAMAAIEFSGGRRESRTVLNVDLEEALEQARPTDAGRRRAVCSVSVIIARVSGVDGLAWDDLGR
jgi:hypothetical protein